MTEQSEQQTLKYDTLTVKQVLDGRADNAIWIERGTTPRAVLMREFHYTWRDVQKAINDQTSLNTQLRNARDAEMEARDMCEALQTVIATLDGLYQSDVEDDDDDD